MKILLINSPIRLDAKPSCIPSGLGTVAAVLLNNGFEVEIFDINAFRPDEDSITSTLSKMTWDLAGVSGLITTYKFQIWIIDILKTLRPEVPIISGGGLATSSPDLLFNKSSVDIAVIGEGEHTMLELCLALKDGKDLSSVQGIGYRENDQVVFTQKRKNIKDLDSIPFPAWDLLPMDIYLKNAIWGDASNNSSGFRNDITIKRSMNIISSRGCPYSCNYCYHLFGRSDYRFRSAQNIIEEIEILVDRYNVDFIGFVDDNMMASEKMLLEFCDLMEKKNFPVTWGCHGRVSSAKPAILEPMAATGCIWIGYGIESGSQKILDAMNKKTTPKRARQAIIDTRRAGIYPNTTFIFGYPGETRETIQETIDFKKDLGINCGSFFATPYPGAPLYDYVKDKISNEELFIESLDNATDFSINLTDLDDASLFRLKDLMDNNKNVYGAKSI